MATGQSPPLAPCLIVEDELRIARSIQRLARAYFDSEVVTTVEAALRFLDEERSLSCLVVDVMLPDGSGVQVLDAFRQHNPELPAVVATAVLDRELVNRVHSLRAEFVCKPSIYGNLGDFFKRVERRHRRAAEGKRHPTEDTVAVFSKKHGLSRRETLIVRLSADGVPRSHLAQVLGVAESTIKSQVRAILHKTACSRMAEVVWAARQNGAEAVQPGNSSPPVEDH